MDERRKINRINFEAKGVIVACDSLEKVYVDVLNLSPLGVAAKAPEGSPKLIGKDVIIVAESIIMYAEVIREDAQDDGSRVVALSGKKFTDDVLGYLFEHISLDEDK